MEASVRQYGHRVKLMAPKFVAPYRKSGKNDGNDAEAVCEAVSRPSMRFVPVKSAEQQALLNRRATLYRASVLNALLDVAFHDAQRKHQVADGSSVGTECCASAPRP
jgi:transposase